MTEFVPADVLAAWAGGLAGAGAVVAWWRIVGPGFLWLTAGTAALFGLPAAAIDTSIPAVAAIVMLGAAAALAHSHVRAAASLGAAAVLFVAAAIGSGIAPALTAAVFLGGVTAEMLLGHWYLVDPTLPRSALFRLDAAAGVGLAAEITLLAARGVFDWADDDAVLGLAFIGLAVLTAVLLGAVWLALREPAYPAVMAATGLSYLAVLTAVGVSVVGRVVLSA